MTTQQIHGALEVFQDHRQRLLGLLRRHRAVAGVLRASALTAAVTALEEQAEQAVLRVLVLGETGRGTPALAAAIRDSGWLDRGGVQVTDSCGIDEPAIRAQVADGGLARADAIIFLVAAAAPFGEDERRYLENFVLPLGHEDIFFVCRHPGEPSVVFQRVSRLRIGGLDQPGGTLWDPRVFVADGADLPWFEEALQRFLAREKGRVKLLTPVRELRARLRETGVLLRELAAMGEQDPRTLADRYEGIRPELDLLDQRGKAIAAGLDHDIAMVEAATGQMTRQFLATLCAKDGEVGPETLLRWQNDIFCRWLRQWLIAIEKRLNADIDEFLAEAYRLRAAVTGATTARTRSVAPSALDELLSGGGDQPGDTVIDVAGARTGTVLDAVLPHIAVLTAALLPGLDGPLDRTGPGLAQGFAGQLGAELRAFSARVERDLAGHARTVREITQTGIRAAEQGPTAARAGDRLGELAAEIDRLEHERDDLEEQIGAL
ncbi:MAG TPA: hypothetical protein VGH27_35680 [Streptosporangiaceae bacterium]|jgi:hypothetical protein